MTSVSRRYATDERRFDRPSGIPADELRAPVVLMVSGGADSTALLVLAATSTLDIDDGRGVARIARERLHVLHINHQLRGIDAQEDEEFVCDLADRYGIPCTVRRVDVAALAGAQGVDTNIENIGREVRYAEAVKLANDLCERAGVTRSLARIVTAHTANDRAETFFMNAIRGTGPAGLSSIPRRRNRIVRPLLERTHRELCEMLRMRGIVWREDQTNDDTRYLRAFVRHELMPVVEARNPRVTSSLSTTCDILSDEDAYLHARASRALRDLTRRSADGMRAIDAGRLAAADVVIARRVVRLAILEVCPAARLEARHVEAVLRIVATGHGSISLPLALDARVEYGLLFLRADGCQRMLEGAWLTVPGRIKLPDGYILEAAVRLIEKGSDPVSVARAHGAKWGQSSIMLDADACGIDEGSGGRLWVAPPSQGELMCPLGMHGQSKLLSDILNESRIPSAERQAVAVVHNDLRGAILWVAGVRADERARVKNTTQLVLVLSKTLA